MSVYPHKSIFILSVCLASLACFGLWVQARAVDPSSATDPPGMDPWDLEQSVADANDPGQIGFREEKPGEWLEGIVGRAADYLLVIGGAVAVLIILAGAYMIFSSGGEPAKVAKGRAAILWAVIGLAALLFVKVIVSIIRYILEF